MQNRSTLAIDPGQTTGCAYTINGTDFFTFTKKMPEELWSLVGSKAYAWDLILCERFAASVISKYGLHTVELVGAVKAICFLRNIKLEIRTPQQRYSHQAFAQHYLEDVRERTGERFVIHQADALAHLMAHLRWEPQ